MTQTPKVSVVMTAYNGEAFVGEAIKSVLAQTFDDFELIVVDDGSQDKTVDIIGGFSDPRVRLIQNPENRGISTSRNTGIDAARGIYIAGHDQDDLSLPERLERSVAVLDETPAAVLVANRSRFQSTGILFPSEDIAPPHVMAWRLFTRSNIYTSSACFRAETLREHGIGYKQTYHYAEDYELYHRLSEVGDIIHLPDPLTIIGDHGANTSIVKQAEMDENAKAFLLDRYRDYAGDDITPRDIDIIWDVAVFGHPARNRADLERLGTVLDRLTAQFLVRRQYSEGRRQDVLEDAGKFWWRVVSRSAQHLGPACLALRGGFPCLKGFRPGPRHRLNALARALAGPVYYRFTTAN